MIRFYETKDYDALKALYEQSETFHFDPVTDSVENIARKIQRDPESILLYEEDGKLTGSVSIVEDGRIALIFRLVATKGASNQDDIFSELMQKAEEIIKSKGLSQVHTTAPAGNTKAIADREKLGFLKGSVYDWYWKVIQK